MHTILVIDDDTAARSILKRIIINKFDARVIQAASGDEGFAALQENIPDLILLDNAMPGMSGLEFLQKLRAEESYAGLPVLVVSANNEREIIQEMIKLGINDYILKPINPKITYERIQEVFSNNPPK
jgi:CheY-like chemotaxis protein